MIIRNGTDSDLEEVISLLRVSLGEDRVPKTLALWHWKHNQNPFGKSPVLVAEAEEKIIGVRAFLKWEYVHDGHVIYAQRAVDTAVHPSEQGKGIFSQLTRKLLERSRLEGTDLIFNTPNKRSTPGYLKLGWEKWDKLPLKIKPVFFSESDVPSMKQISWEEVSHLVDQLEQRPKEEISGLQTHFVKGYLNWRYRDCPIVNYKLISDLKSFLLVYRIKDSIWGKELRICDVFTLENSDNNVLSKQLSDLERIEKPRFVTVSGFSATQKLAQVWKFLPTLPLGPLVTLKQLNTGLQPLNLPWAWSLGDLELF